jgi:hypothetical protein
MNISRQQALAELKAHQARVLAKILQDINPDEQPSKYRTPPGGDNQRLRGIPAVGRGVAGAIPNTTPGAFR